MHLFFILFHISFLYFFYSLFYREEMNNISLYTMACNLQLTYTAFLFPDKAFIDTIRKLIEDPQEPTCSLRNSELNHDLAVCTSNQDDIGLLNFLVERQVDTISWLWNHHLFVLCLCCHAHKYEQDRTVHTSYRLLPH